MYELSCVLLGLIFFKSFLDILNTNMIVSLKELSCITYHFLSGKSSKYFTIVTPKLKVQAVSIFQMVKNLILKVKTLQMQNLMENLGNYLGTIYPTVILLILHGILACFSV